jgi:hypothetical protein
MRVTVHRSWEADRSTLKRPQNKEDDAGWEVEHIEDIEAAGDYGKVILTMHEFIKRELPDFNSNDEFGSPAQGPKWLIRFSIPFAGEGTLTATNKMKPLRNSLTSIFAMDAAKIKKLHEQEAQRLGLKVSSNLRRQQRKSRGITPNSKR